jgi:hypothetical protein
MIFEVLPDYKESGESYFASVGFDGRGVAVWVAGQQQEVFEQLCVEAAVLREKNTNSGYSKTIISGVDWLRKEKSKGVR